MDTERSKFWQQEGVALTVGGTRLVSNNPVAKTRSASETKNKICI